MDIKFARTPEEKAELEKQGYRSLPGFTSPFQQENTMPIQQQEDKETGVLGSVGRGLAAGTLDIAGAAANWAQGVGLATYAQGLVDVGFSVDKYIDDINEKYFSMPPSVAPLDPLDFRWWGYNLSRMAPSYVMQAGTSLGLALLGVPAPLARLAGAGIGAGMEGGGAIEESLDRGDRGTVPLEKGIKMSFAAGLLNYISLGNVLKLGGPGFGAKLYKMAMSGVTEALTEMAEEPANDHLS